MTTLLFYLIAGHALADFSLQGDTMAREKSRHSETLLQAHVPWFYWLTAHALIHGLTVTLITGRWYLGVLETACHWLIDFGKCESRYSIHVDQFLHVTCKCVWFAVTAL